MTNKTKRLIEDFEKAVRLDEMKGSQDPEDMDNIEKHYKKTKNRLLYHVGYLEASCREDTL